jgi:DNA gyrase/topoisomerase IV subunit A
MHQETRDISEVLETNIKDYQTELIQNRAISSWRDGLIPCGRRLIKSLEDVKAYYDKPTVKSAKIVGDCMGKYHAHGDSGIANALCTLVNQCYPLVYGHGNWGNITDGPAATRYTECKLSPIGMKMLECKNIAKMVKNYTGELEEYIDIPSRFPAFFVNGIFGIAVGIRVNIPDHNLEEIVDCLKYVLKHPDANTNDLLKFVKGPDYKYGGRLLSTKSDLFNLYDTNNGSLIYECHYSIEKCKKGYLLTVKDCCPGFDPEVFLKSMAKLHDEKIILYANDSSDINNSCKIEVVYRNSEDFEDYIHKHLIKSVKYQIYSVTQEPSRGEEKDLDIELCTDNFINLMKRWLNWRKEVEIELNKNQKHILDLDLHHLELKLKVANNLDIVKKSLQSEDTSDILEKSLKVNREDCKYILSLSLDSIKRLEISRIEKYIADLNKNIEYHDNLIKNPDISVLTELKNLKEFYKPRLLESI